MKTESTTPAQTKPDSPPLVNTLHVHANGPYTLEAEIEIRGQKHDTPLVALCRCGHSQIKPYCDGSHKSINFQAE